MNSSVLINDNYVNNTALGIEGQDRQQLIMFWATHFTDADTESAGFIDGNSGIDHHIRYEDIFDDQGRPHVVGRRNWE